MKRAWTHEEATAAPSRPEPTTRATLAALPPSLVREHVFCFLAAPALLSAEQFHADDYKGQLAPLRAVCRQWKATVDSLWGETKRARRDVYLCTMGDKNKARWLDDAAREGPLTRCLTLQIDLDVRRATRPVDSEGHSAEADADVLEREFWTSFFGCFDSLERLELARVPFDALADVIPAAAATCPRVRAVVLPVGPMFRLDDDPTSGAKELDAVTEGLKTWYHRNGDPVLRGRHFGSSHGHNEPITPLGLSDKIVWADFCRICTELREIDWQLASLWAPYVAAFCETPKPQLRKMVVRDLRGRADVDLALTWVQSAFRVAPKLRRLEVELTGRIFFLVTENHTAYADITSTIADAFVLDLVEKCPRLEHFQYKMQSSDRELTVTTSSLSALIAMPSIRDIELTRVVMDTVSLPALIQSTRERAHGGCEYCSTLRVNLTAADAAHDAIVALLYDLAENPSGYFDLHLYLRIGREYMVRNTYPRGILVKNLVADDELKRLVSTIKHHFSGSRVTVSIHTYCFGVKAKRHAISELTLDVASGLKLRPACEIYFEHAVPQYKRKAGRIA